MLCTNPDDLKRFYSENRIWQGIPSIEVTEKGRVFLTFYSGGTREEIGNYVILVKSDDGMDFSEPVAAAFLEDHRCFDPCLWIDPLKRLWFTWSCSPDNAVYAAVCDNPDADVLKWGGVFKIGNDVMMNKPVVLKNGEWLFPVAVWAENVFVYKKYSTDPDKKAFAYLSRDDGKSFCKLGGVDAPGRAFDEHMIIELDDNLLAMLIRTNYGIAVSYSYNNGRSWTEARDSRLGGPCSRFHIRRLRSGRILLVNHYNFVGRNNLTAMLSEDNGKSWKYKLMLDERSDVSYPDAAESNGYIYITYDRERGAFKNRLEDAYGCAREILTAKITEEDIIAGKLVNSGSYLKGVASKLGRYSAESTNPYNEIKRCSDAEIVRRFAGKSADDIIYTLFEQFGINCMNMYKMDSRRLDNYIDALKNGSESKEKAVREIVKTIRGATDCKNTETELVSKVKEYIRSKLFSNTPLEEIAADMNVSKYYLCHEFKKITNMTLTEWKNYQRIEKAKEMLVNGNSKITDIALECGFENPSYFSEIFKISEKIAPEAYRALLRETRLEEKDAILKSMLPECRLCACDINGIEKNGSIKTYFVAKPGDEFKFLHEAAITEYNGRLFAAWYNNEKAELTGRTPIRFSVSDDCGKSWSEPVTVVEDKSGKILYCPPVFGKEDGRLYMFLNRMVSADHMHSLDLYIYNEKTNNFERSWSKPIPFKLNTNIYKMSNGKLIMPGRIAEPDGFPQIPAVMISDSGKIDSDWRIINITDKKELPDNSEFIHPEVSLILNENRIYAFCRNDQRNVPIVFLSEDFGESWQGPFASDIPFSSSKIYSGTLSDGRNYVTGNIGANRKKLCIFFSSGRDVLFDGGCVLQDGFSEELNAGYQWSYPCAYESGGRLYVIYTVTLNKNNERGAVVSVIENGLFT